MNQKKKKKKKFSMFQNTQTCDLAVKFISAILDNEAVHNFNQVQKIEMTGYFLTLPLFSISSIF